MSESFDPYHKWLGISPKDQPPDPYRLLGIERFESDPDVIANAADQRMGHMRTFQAGKRGDLSQKLLNEISRAKVDLLDPKKKQQIDAELKAQVQAIETTPLAGIPWALPVPVAAEPAPSATDLERSAPRVPTAQSAAKPEPSPSVRPPMVPGAKGGAGSASVASGPVRPARLAPPAPKPASARAQVAKPQTSTPKPNSSASESEPMNESSTRPAPDQQPETAAEPGVVVFLVDESSAMEARVAGATKSKADTVATAVNSLLNQLTGGPELHVALVGYRLDQSGASQIGLRWGGALSQERFVTTGELERSPLRVEDRVRKIPGPGGVGVSREETIKFPLWYEPKLGGAASRADAFAFCAELLRDREVAGDSTLKRPILVSFLGEIEDEDLAGAVAKVTELETPGGSPLVLHVHLTSLARVPPVLYPSAEAPLPPGRIRQVFHASSVLPDAMASALREMRVMVNQGARGMVFNGKMADLIRLLSLVKTYAELLPAEPEPAATTEKEEPPTVPSVAAAQQAAPPSAAGGERRALVVLVLDRSTDDPQAEHTVWERIQKRANETLAEIAKCGQGSIDVAVVSYGRGSGGETDVQRALGAETFVTDKDLAQAALRVEEVTEEVFNGVGGLVMVKRKKPVFIDLDPAGPATCAPAFEAVRDTLRQWRNEHPGAGAAPIVLHVTRGRVDPAELSESAGQLLAAEESQRPPLLYHLVLTESPRRAVAYPADADEIADEAIRALWASTSPLVAREAFAAKRPGITADARGFVVNGQFDLLLEDIEHALGPADPRSTDGGAKGEGHAV